MRALDRNVFAAVFVAAVGCAPALAAPSTADAKSSSPMIASPVAEAATRPTDHLSIDKLLNDSKPTAATSAPSSAVAKAIDVSDWAPEHPSLPATVKPADDGAAAAKTDATTAASKPDEKAIDLGPDEAVKVPPPAPAHDPLDAAKPADDKAATAALAPDALSPMQQAIKSVLDKRATLAVRGVNAAEMKKEREAIALYYAAHGFDPAWSEDKKPIAAVDSVLAQLGHAGDDALSIGDVPTALKTDGSLDEIADSDIALTDAVVAYARQATGSRIDPASISPLIGARPELADPNEVLDSLVAAGASAGNDLQALNPIEPRYVALRQKLTELRSVHSTASDDLPIPSGPTLRVGMHDPRVPLIRSRFSLDVIGDDDAQLEYDTQVADAVAGFQRANGLPPSGALTKRTVAALSGESVINKSSHVADVLAANMEMWRWMPRDLGVDRVEVNVPDYTVTVIRDGEATAKNRVVVGKPDTPTPIFSKAMKYVIVNPVWYVPQSIIRKEWGGSAPRGFNVTYIHGQMIVKQPPGARNALGRIKFIFPNDYSVYLHDTQAKGLFSAARRAYSHGCVRVDQPFDFGEAVLNASVSPDARVQWSKKRLMSLLGDHERYIDLPKPLPIHIEYFTASVDPETDKVILKEDVYDYARKVASILAHQS